MTSAEKGISLSTGFFLLREALEYASRRTTVGKSTCGFYWFSYAHWTFSKEKLEWSANWLNPKKEQFHLRLLDSRSITKKIYQGLVNKNTGTIFKVRLFPTLQGLGKVAALHLNRFILKRFTGPQGLNARKHQLPVARCYFYLISRVGFNTQSSFHSGQDQNSRL